MGPKTLSCISKIALSILGLAIGTTLLSSLPGAAAEEAKADVTEPSPLYELDSRGSRVTIFMSNVTPTIFGEDATNFDYIMNGEPDRAIESLRVFAAAHSTNETDAILLAFVNATMGGTMKPDQAANMTWLCNELSGNQASTLGVCDGHIRPKWIDVQPTDLLD